MRLAIALLALGACGDSPSGNGDGGADGTSSDPDASSVCEGPCKVTNLTAMFKSTRTLDTAYYGTNFDSPALRIEAYKKASPGCPTSTSPTPDYTLVLGEVDPSLQTQTMSTANILDFKGDLLGGPLGLAATMRQVDRTAYVAPMFIAVDVMLTFSSGTVTGHIYATHCATLDQ